MKNKAAVFIDGSNLYAAGRGLEMQVDYAKMLTWLRDRNRLVRAYYYTAINEDQTGYSVLQPLADWLSYNGFQVVTKAAKTFIHNGVTKVKGNMDIEIAVDVLEIASSGIDEIILFSGDGDFRRLVESVQRLGIHVTVISTLKSNPPMVADELRRQADEFIDLETIRKFLEKTDDNIGNRKARVTA